MHNAESEFSKKSFKKNGFQKYVLRQLLFTHNAELGSLFISSNNFSLCHACVSTVPGPKGLLHIHCLYCTLLYATYS